MFTLGASAKPTHSPRTAESLSRRRSTILNTAQKLASVNSTEKVSGR